METLEGLTQYYINLGFDIIEARKRAITRMEYLRECNSLNPSENKVDKYVYQK